MKIVSLYKCKVCSELVLCDCAIIKKHLERHKLTLSAYRRIHHPKDAQNLQAQYIMELKAAIKHISAVKFTPESYGEPSTIPIDQTTGNIGNLCFFKCLDCFKSDMSYSTFQVHQNTKHKSNNNYSLKNKIDIARYHRCQICASNVLCDNYFIKNHLKQYHQISVTEYSTRYILNNGFRTYPTFTDYCKNNHVFRSFNNAKENE